MLSLSFSRSAGCKTALVVAPLCLALAAAPGGASVTGCTTHACDPGTVCLVGDSLMGTVYASGDEVVWQSASVAGEPWLDYQGQHTYSITYPTEFMKLASPGVAAASTCTDDHSPPLDVVPRVWVSANFADVGSNQSDAVGQLAEYTGFRSTGFDIFNATCQYYVMRFEVRARIASAGDAGPPEAQVEN